MPITPISDNQDSNEKLLQELLRITKYFTDASIEYRLGGSFALCLYAESFALTCGDLDFVCKTREMHDQAVTLLVSALGYRVEKQEEWKDEAERKNVNTVLFSSEDVRVEVACVNDIILSETCEILSIQDSEVRVFTLHDLQTTYQAFADRKPGTQEKLQLIERLIAQRS